MNIKNNITMTKFNLTKYYKHEEKLGPQGGGVSQLRLYNKLHMKFTQAIKRWVR